MIITDYDTRRASAIEPETESLDLLHERRARALSDLDEVPADEYELPGFEILDVDMSAPVVPMGGDEFRCGGCFLVLHHSLRSGTRAGADICRDCS